EATQIPSWPSEGSRQSQAAGKPKQVQETWGVFYDIMCAGKDSTFTFLEGVLDEVVELFPSRYIHVGGDEAPKSNWKRCPRCQARMKAEGLKDEHELQSYLIQRVERYVNGKGRRIIGWDEILEGGLAPNAAVMSWQGTRGGAQAARAGHEVIMTPTKPCYFDYAQVKPEDSLVWGGYNPLDSVYAWEPVPQELDSATARYILGGQANLWTEYMANPAKVEYMLLPRLAALSEALWTPKEKKNWASFGQRLPALFNRYDRRGWNASRAYYFLQPVLSYNNNNGQKAAEDGSLFLGFSSRMPGAQISYTRKSDAVLKINAYKDGIIVPGSDSIVVALIGPDGRQVQAVPFSFRFSKSTGRMTTLATQPSANYPGLGAMSLINGIWSTKGLASTDWLGFLGKDMDATIDLGKAQPISRVRFHTLDQNGSWIYLPQSVEIQVSDDGQNFRALGESKEFLKEKSLRTRCMELLQCIFEKK
ncbi:MAG: beta-N-acetylhexosaminidase, partial [Sphingobacteriales bacterium]